MNIFSYAIVYAFCFFVLYLMFKFFRFAFVRIKAFVIRRKCRKLTVNAENFDSEKKDD